MYSPLASAGGADEPGGCIKKVPRRDLQDLKVSADRGRDIASPPDTERTKLSMTALQDTTPQPKNQHVTIEGVLHPARIASTPSTPGWPPWRPPDTNRSAPARAPTPAPAPYARPGPIASTCRATRPSSAVASATTAPNGTGSSAGCCSPEKPVRAALSGDPTPRGGTRTADRQRDAPPDDRGVAYALRIWSAAASTPKDMTAPRAYLGNPPVLADLQ